MLYIVSVQIYYFSFQFFFVDVFSLSCAFFAPLFGADFSSLFYDVFAPFDIASFQLFVVDVFVQPYALFLDSAQITDRLGRYSFIAVDPFLTIIKGI